MMKIFHYLYKGHAHTVACGAGEPGPFSPVWTGCSTSVWLVPGTWKD